MKQYEIRTKDLKSILLPVLYLSQAQQWMSEHPDRDGNCVIVLHELETESEADKARLDCMENNPRNHVNPSFDYFTQEFMNSWSLNTGHNYPTLREAIDVARKAQQPTVTVIATLE